MNLYEVTNGWTGESYQRVYVWAADEAQALDLARQSYKDNQPGWKHDDSWWERLNIRLLFSGGNEPFATKPSDSGFDDDGV